MSGRGVERGASERAQIGGHEGGHDFEARLVRGSTAHARTRRRGSRDLFGMAGNHAPLSD